MIYSVDLRMTGLVVGVVLLATHLGVLWQRGACEKGLQRFPRSQLAGAILITVAGVWSFLLVRTMDLGEFARLRGMILFAIVAGAFLAWRYVEEFLAVRALGMVALLAAEPLLEAAFLQPQASRLLLVVLAYAWIILGLFWVGMPWTLRDQIGWLTARRGRLTLAAAAGACYGVLVLLCAMFFWK